MQQGAISKRNSVSFPDCVCLWRDEDEITFEESWVCGNVEKVLRPVNVAKLTL